MHSFLRIPFLMTGVLTFMVACGGGSGGPPDTTASGNIQISWNGNLETAVNRAGGGYMVYYSAIMVACGGGSGGPPDTTAPTVISGPLVDAARNQVIAESARQ